MAENFDSPVAWTLTRYGANGEEQFVAVFIGEKALEEAKLYAENWAEHDLQWNNVAVKTYTASEHIVGYSFRIFGSHINPTWSRSPNHNRKLTLGY